MLYRNDLQPFRRFVQLGLVLLLASGIMLYVLYQARFLIVGPTLTLNNVPSTLQNSRTVTLEGTATNIAALTLNGYPIFTDPQGNFQATVILENGYTVTTLAAVDRYGRRTELRQPFVFERMTFNHVDQ
jgi:large exoprotein involved in heme utilization and adhesion